MSVGYTEPRFREKLGRAALQAGREVIEKALWLFYAAQRPETPAWARTIIYGSLAYFISPLDAIPDLTPLLGYTDDLAALAAALAMVSLYVDDAVKARAAKKLEVWFGKN